MVPVPTNGMHLDYFEHDKRKKRFSAGHTIHRDDRRQGQLYLEKKYTSCQRGLGVYCDVSKFTGGAHLRVAIASSGCERDT